MPASKYDFTIEQGTSFRLSLVYKDQNHNVIDITNWCARLTWVTNTGTTETFTTDNIDPDLYSFTIDGANGKLTLLLPASITNDFIFKTARYDLELQSDDDLYVGGGKETIRILYGIVSINSRYSNSNTLLEC
jgi:hypothetical protein